MRLAASNGKQYSFILFSFETDFTGRVKAGPQIETWQRRSAAAFTPVGCLRGWLTQLGHSLPALRQAGLVLGVGYDAYVRRIVFPLEGNLYGRSLSAEAPPHRFLPTSASRAATESPELLAARRPGRCRRFAAVRSTCHRDVPPFAAKRRSEASSRPTRQSTHQDSRGNTQAQPRRIAGRDWPYKATTRPGGPRHFPLTPSFCPVQEQRLADHTESWSKNR